METISLLWPEDQREVKTIQKITLDDLGITCLIDAVFSQKPQHEFAIQCMEKLSMDVKVISYRQEIFRELYENPQFFSRICVVLEKVKDLQEVQKYHVIADKKSGLLTLIDRLYELQTYINVILAMNESFENITLQSEGFQRMKEMVSEISCDKGFQELMEDIRELIKNMGTHQSVTIGLNLDSLLRVDEVILLSLNSYRHKRKLPILKRFGHFIQEMGASTQSMEESSSFYAHKSDYQDPRMRNLEYILAQDLETLTKKMGTTLQKYVDINGATWTKMIPELEFYIGFVRFFLKIRESGQPLCIPNLLKEKTPVFKIKDCYNVKLILKHTEDGVTQPIVHNDFTIDESGDIFILTGPNSGGKTTYTQAVGCCIILAQQGLAVFGSEYYGIVFDQVFTHFPSSEEETVHLGRLGEEAKRISEIMLEATDKSMVLFNETYSTTSFSEGLYLAKDLVRALKYRRIAAIYNTHMHELAMDIPVLNTNPGEGKIESLVMGMEQGTRSYKVLRKSPENSSYAKDIACKYGVTYQQLIGEEII